MTRPIRIDVAGGWYHITARGLERRAGGRERYRRAVEGIIRQGGKETAGEQRKAQVLIGSREFIERIKRGMKRLSKEQAGRRDFTVRIAFERIVAVVEQERGEKWARFAERHGDWGRDLVFYLARRRSGLTLREIGEKTGGVDYKTVSKAIERFARQIKKNHELDKVMTRCLNVMSIVET